MSKRLSEVVPDPDKVGAETSLITKITNLGYHKALVAKSLWCLKPGEELNKDILNLYFELLRKSGVSAV
jgi:Ulp1 family protease